MAKIEEPTKEELRELRKILYPKIIAKLIVEEEAGIPYVNKSCMQSTKHNG